VGVPEQGGGDSYRRIRAARFVYAASVDNTGPWPSDRGDALGGTGKLKLAGGVSGR